MVVVRVKAKLWIIGLLLIIGACTGNTLFDEHIDFPDQTWAQSDVKSFSFAIEEEENPYAIRFFVRNTMNYPMQNLYVQWALKDSLGTVLQEELLNIPLFEEKTGRPLNKGFSDMATHEVLLDSGFVFPYSGTFTLSAEQYMRTEKLEGLLGIGIQISMQDE